MANDDHHKHFVGQVAQKALIEKDGKILLVQYPASDPNTGMWDLPGGRLHVDETALEGVCREVEEEIGSTIAIDGIAATGVNVVGDWKLFFVIYRAHLVDPDKPLVPEQDEIGTIAWHPKADFFTLPIIARGYQEVLRDILQ